MMDKIRKGNLIIANLRYYEEPFGVEFGDSLSTVILYKEDNCYFNIFDITEDYPVFERSTTYGEYDSTGEQIGTKMKLKSGWLRTGPCFVIEQKMFNDFEKDEDISFEELEDLILDNERFFKDRMDIANRRYRKKPIKLLKVMKKDRASQDYMKYYFMEREMNKVKKI